MKPKVSVIVPAFNEEGGIGATIQEIIAETHALDIEIIVVDDGSSDGTAEAARPLAHKVVRHPVNRGKGAAMKTGFMASTGDFVVFTDADLTYPANHIPEVVAKLDDFDAVFTRRTSQSNIPLLNRLGNWLISRSVRELAGFGGEDPLSGLYGLRREVLTAIDLQSSTFAVETEIVVKTSRMRYRCAEIPIEYRPRVGTSKLKPFRDGIRIFRVLMDLLFIFRPSVTFGVPGAGLSLLGMLVALGIMFNDQIPIGRVRLGISSFLGAIAVMLIGVNVLTYGAIIELYAIRNRFKKPSRVAVLLLEPIFYDSLRNASLAVLFVGAVGSLHYILTWAASGFGEFDATKWWMMSLSCILLGVQGVFASIVGRIFCKESRERDTIGE